MSADFSQSKSSSTAMVFSRPAELEKTAGVSESIDELELAFFGKKQRLKRRFGLISIIGLSCTLMITWEGILMVLAQSLGLGGPLGAICAFIFAWVGVTSQTLVMAEMASMIPLAGGQYNWVAILAPPGCSRFLSYLTGWITATAWQSATASGIYLVGTIVQGVAKLNHPTYEPTQWQTTLVFYAMIAVAVFINTILVNILPQLESWILVLHVLGFFGILIPLTYLGPKADASFVFQTFVQGGGWSTDGIVFLVGLNVSMLAFIGIDGATHMAEEIENASRVIPKAMITAITINGVTGFAMLVAALFSIPNLDDALSDRSGYPFVHIFETAVGSAAGATGMSVVLLLAMIFATIGVLATSSRMLWAFAREAGVPGHRWISRVHERSSLPLVSVGISTLINVLLALINIGSVAAFNAFISLTVAAFYMSFTLSTGCLLWRKLTHQQLRYGPWKLGKAGIPISIFALGYSFIGALFSFWPAVVHPTLEQMNWASVVFCGVISISLVYWVLQARKSYVGPLTEITVEELERKRASPD